jgi:predicted dehydrogenase
MSAKIKVGIWGLGRAGINMHTSELQKYTEMYEIVAGMDPDAKHRKIFTEKSGAKAYDSEEEFLNDPNIEMFSIATRSLDHVAHCEKALATGKYVFLEKPIAVTYEGGLKLLELDKKYPGKLYLRHNRRFEAPFNHICEIMDSGVLGEVYEIKLCRHSFQRRSDWQTIIDCGGGQLNNWGPHIIDHALQFLDYKVKEMWSDLKKIAAVGDAEDHLKIVFKGESGRVVDLEISGGAALPQNEYTLFGTRGALICNGNDIKMKYVDPEQVFQKLEAYAGNPPLEGGFSNGYADLEAIRWIEKEIKVNPSVPTDTHCIWPAMYKSIREGVKFPVSIEEGVAVVKVIDEVKKNTEFSQA